MEAWLQTEFNTILEDNQERLEEWTEGKVHVLMTLQDGKCANVTICAPQYEWPLIETIGAAGKKDLEVIDNDTRGLRTAECFEEVKAKHVELNSIVAAIIKVMNDMIGNKLPRSKAIKNPDTVPPFYPGPPKAYAKRAQDMKRCQLMNVIHSIFDFIQQYQWGPQDIRDLRDALVKAAWHPLASSVGTWAALNCCFQALEDKARAAAYKDRRNLEDGLKLAQPYVGWRAVGPDKIWKEVPKKHKRKKSGKGSDEEEEEEQAEDEQEDEGGSESKRRVASPAEVEESRRAGLKDGRQQGGGSPMPLLPAPNLSGGGGENIPTSPESVALSGSVGARSSLAPRGNRLDGRQRRGTPWEARPPAEASPLLNSVIPWLEPMEMGNDGDWTFGGGSGRFVPDPSSSSPRGTESDTSTLIHLGGGSGVRGSSGGISDQPSSAVLVGRSGGSSPLHFGSEDTPSEYRNGASWGTSPLPSFDSSTEWEEMLPELPELATAEAGSMLGANGASHSQQVDSRGSLSPAQAVFTGHEGDLYDPLPPATPQSNTAFHELPRGAPVREGHGAPARVLGQSPPFRGTALQYQGGLDQGTLQPGGLYPGPVHQGGADHGAVHQVGPYQVASVQRGPYQTAVHQGGANHGAVHPGGTYQEAVHPGGAYQTGVHQGGAYQEAGHQGGAYQGAVQHGGAYQGAGHQGGGHQAAVYQGGAHRTAAPQGVAYQVTLPQGGTYQAAAPQGGPYHHGGANHAALHQGLLPHAHTAPLLEPTPQLYYDQYPLSRPQPQHRHARSLPPAEPGHIRAPLSPGQGHRQAEPMIQYPGHSNVFPGGQPWDERGGPGAAVPPERMQRFSVPNPVKLMSDFGRKFKKSASSPRGAVAERGIPQGGPTFQGEQPPQLRHYYSDPPRSAHVDPRAVHYAQDRHPGPSPTYAGQFRPPVPVMAAHTNPADEAKPGSPMEPFPRARGIPPGRERGAGAAASAESLVRDMQALSLRPEPVHTLPHGTAGAGVKPGVRAAPIASDDGKAHRVTAPVQTDAGGLAGAKAPAKADAVGAADRSDGPESVASALAGADAADGATETEESDGEYESDESSDGAESDEESDDGDVTTDASGDQSDGADVAERTVPGPVVTETSPTVLAAPDVANGPNAHSYAHGERPAGVYRNAPEAAHCCGAHHVVTGATPAARNISNSDNPAVAEGFQQCHVANPHPGNGKCSGDRGAKLPPGRAYRPPMGVSIGTGDLGGLSAIAAAGLPAGGSGNGTTANGCGPWVGVPGPHSGQRGSASGGASKRVCDENLSERARAQGSAYEDGRTESPASVLFQPGVMQTIKFDS